MLVYIGLLTLSLLDTSLIQITFANPCLWICTFTNIMIKENLVHVFHLLINTAHPILVYYIGFPPPPWSTDQLNYPSHNPIYPARIAIIKKVRLRWKKVYGQDKERHYDLTANSKCIAKWMWGYDTPYTLINPSLHVQHV